MYSGEDDEIKIANNGDVQITTEGELCQYSLKEDQEIQVQYDDGDDAGVTRQDTVKKEMVEDQRIGMAAEPIKVDEEVAVVAKSPSKFAFPDDDDEEEGVQEDQEMNDREGEDKD